MTTATTEPVDAYRAIPYGFHAYRDTQPPVLHALARLFGLNPAPPDRARVLELGCARGGNLLPFALGCPGAECSGVDLCAAQIGSAEETAAALELTNVRFRAADLRELGAELGRFDYLICHGVYSWVPADAQRHILRLCRELLTPDGVALVSYNALPGWHWVRPLRDLLLLSTRTSEDPAGRARRGLELMKILAEGEVITSPVFRSIVQQEQKLLEQRSLSYFAHDHLESHNSPCYLLDFVRQARSHGLEYMCDAQLCKMYPENLPAASQEWLRGLGDPLLREQHQDLLVGRRFRSTILCHAERTPRSEPDLARLRDLHLLFPFQPASPVPDPLPTSQAFKLDAATVTVRTPLAVALFVELARRHPFPTLAAEVVAAARRHVPEASEEDLYQSLEAAGGNLLRRGCLTVTSHATPAARHVAGNPVAWPLARVAAQQHDTAAVFSPLDTRLVLDPFSRRLLALLDGTRDRQQLVQALTAALVSGALRLSQQRGPAPGPREARRWVGELLDRALADLASHGFLCNAR